MRRSLPIKHTPFQRTSLQRTLSLRGLTLSVATEGSNHVAHESALSSSVNAGQVNAGQVNVVQGARRLSAELIAGRVSPAAAFAALDLPPGVVLADELVRFPAVPAYSLPTYTPPAYTLPVLPTGYGFKGGAARKALCEALAVSNSAPLPRDLDLIRMRGHSKRADERLMRELNLSDFERGASVEEVRSYEHYFRSRDLTINEVLVRQSSGVATLLAVLDIIGRTLRACRYRGGTMHTARRLDPMTVAKCLRLATEEEDSGQRAWIIVGVPHEQAVTSLAIAVQVKKALERGAPAAARFLKFCIACQIGFAADGFAADGSAADNAADPSLGDGRGSAQRGVPAFIAELLQDLSEGEHFFNPQERAMLAAL